MLYAAGADIKEMKDKNFAEVYRSNFLGSWARVTSFRKPIVGAVSGYAVGARSFFRFIRSDLPSNPFELPAACDVARWRLRTGHDV